MKTLVLAIILAAGFGFGSGAFAGQEILSDTEPVEEQDITQNILDSYIPLDLDIVDSLTIKQSTKPGFTDQIENLDERDYFYAIGVPFNFIDFI